MGTYLMVGLIVLGYILSIFVKRVSPWVSIAIYLVAIIYFIATLMKNDTQPFSALIFIIVSLYGITNSYRRLRASGKGDIE